MKQQRCSFPGWCSYATRSRESEPKGAEASIQQPAISVTENATLNDTSKADVVLSDWSSPSAPSASSTSSPASEAAEDKVVADRAPASNGLAASHGTAFEDHSLPQESGMIRLKVQRDPGTHLGLVVVVVPCPSAVVLVTSTYQGIISDWNKLNPDKAVRVGSVIAEVNGETAAWAIAEELTKCGLKRVLFDNTRVAEFCKSDAPGRLWTISSARDPMKYNVRSFVLRSAGEANVDCCAICVDSVEPHEEISVLSCGHGFHQVCISRWLQEGTKSTCPLCAKIEW